MNNPVGAFVYNAHPGLVDTILVDGARRQARRRAASASTRRACGGWRSRRATTSCGAPAGRPAHGSAATGSPRPTWRGAEAMSAARATRELHLELYRRMLMIRRFEDLVQALFLRGEVYGTTHLYSGQEAVAVGFASALEPDDRVACTYRGHGHALALGLEPERLLAELLGRATGVNGGRAGSMNVVDLDHGLIGCFGIVGGSIAAATGVALALRGQRPHRGRLLRRRHDQPGLLLRVPELREGASSLPLVFVCENNGYGEYTPMAAVTAGEICARADGDGDPDARRRRHGHPRDARGRAGGRSRRSAAAAGPVFVEARTYRFVGHSRSDPGPLPPRGRARAVARARPADARARRGCASTSTAPSSASPRSTPRSAQQMAEIEAAALAAPFPTPGADLGVQGVAARRSRARAPTAMRARGRRAARATARRRSSARSCARSASRAA